MTKLKVNVKDVSACEKLLTIDVPSEIVSEEFSSFYNSVSKSAKIPGFRPGHAPKHVVAIHYKEQARQEVLKHLLSKSFYDAVRQEEIPIVGHPHIEGVEFDESRLKYKAHIEMRPKMKLDRYTGLNVKRDPVVINDSEVNDMLKRFQETHAKFQPVEGRGSQIGDFLVCDYRLEVEGKEIEKRPNEWIEIREKDYLEGFSKQLIGARPTETKNIEITFPKEYVRKEFSEKKGIFQVTVHEIKEKKLPLLDDELAKEAGEYASIAELKDSVRRDIESHRQKESEVKLENALLSELLKKAKFDIPPRMVERRLNYLVQDAIENMIYRGIPKEEAAKEQEKLKKELVPEAERQVRLSFIIDEIADREKVTASEDELNRRFETISERVRRPVSDVKAYYEEEPERRDSLMLQIVSEKVIQLIKDKAVIEDSPARKS